MTATSLSSTTGSSANSFSTRSYFSAQPVTLTGGGTNTLFTLMVSSNSIAGLELSVTVYGTDGTDWQTQTASALIDCMNKAGSITNGVNLRTNATVASLSTLGYSVLAEASGTTNVLVRVAANSGLSLTTFAAKWSVVNLNATGIATVTPQ